LRRYRFWFSHIIAAVVWTGFGIALTIVTVLWPRKAELSHAAGPSPFLQRLQIKNTLESAGVNPAWTYSNEPQTQTIGWTPSGSGHFRQFMASTKVKHAEQQAFTTKISDALVAAAQGPTQGRIWRNGPTVYSATDSLLTLDRHQFMGDGLAGMIEVWGIGHGDQITIVVSVYEQ
jgi:hypothetical protein